MTKEFKYLMHLLAVSATGVEAKDAAEINWEYLVKIAGAQGAVALVACALNDNSFISCPENIKAVLCDKTKKYVFSAFLRHTESMRLLAKLEDEGISSVLLKGYTLSRLYKNPMYRISSDTDILIKPEDEKRTCEFLEKYGFNVQARWQHENHAECTHPKIGLLEVHTLLYEEMVEEIWFNNTDGNEFIREPYRRVEDSDGCFNTLGDTDNLIFITLHMIKHFITGGMTLRMMMDVALFFKENAKNIDTKRFWETLESLRYRKLIDNVFWSMILYCGFSHEDFPGLCEKCPESVDTVLSDIENGGLKEQNETGREQAWIEYNRRQMMKNKDRGEYKRYMLKYQLGLLFPPRAALEKKYPYIKDHAWLIPVAWLHRLLFRGFKATGNGTTANKMMDEKAQISAEEQNRIDLFSKLDML